MKNQKGLTLVELLATLVVLALISGIIISNVAGSVREKKAEVSSYQKKLIEEASESYMANEINDNNIDCVEKTVTVGELIDNGYLSDDYNKFKDQQVRIECIKKSENNIYKYTLISS